MEPVIQDTACARITGPGEFGLIGRIAAGAVPYDGAGVVTGIGDDAAVTSLSEGMQLLSSTDMLLEGVHFRRCWHDAFRLGRKSLAVSVSDIAAMGGNPRWALLSLALPRDLPLEFFDEFVHGFLAFASENRVALIGGDTCTSRSGLAISVTVMGEQYPERIIRRSGAMAGNDIWVTGTLGDAALGLELLEAGVDFAKPDGADGCGYLISRLLDPVPRVSAALALADAGLATAMIDISDGILADFGHIAEQSGVGGCLRLADLPLSAPFKAGTAHLPVRPFHLALSGGEDYELCFTAPSTNREKIISTMKTCGVEVTPVGIVNSCPEVAVINPGGGRCNVTTAGFNHFA